MPSPSPQRSLPQFIPITCDDGRLELGWAALPGEVCRAVLLIALREITAPEAEAFWRGELDSDLIRVPIGPASQSGQASVPQGRPLYVALVLFDEQGALVPSPPVREMTGLGLKAEMCLPEAPVKHSAPPGRDIPLIFAGDQGPDLQQLAARARRGLDGDTDGSPPPASGGAFGSRQRWTLTRLTWVRPEESQQALVVRSTYISPAEIESWRTSLPSDSIPLPSGVQSLTDGRTALGSTAFFSVLHSTKDGWIPAPISPLPPPFVCTGGVFLLGDVSRSLIRHTQELLERLQTTPVAGTDLPLLLELVDAALRTTLEPGPHYDALMSTLASLKEQGLR